MTREQTSAAGLLAALRPAFERAVAALAQACAVDGVLAAALLDAHQLEALDLV